MLHFPLFLDSEKLPCKRTVREREREREREAIEVFGMDFSKKLSFLVFLLCVLISLKNQKGSQTVSGSSSSAGDTAASTFRSRAPSWLFSSKVAEKKSEDVSNSSKPLEYDFYRQSCPQSHQIIRSAIRRLHRERSDVAPALVRLVFHDCFIQGCDASVLLDPAEGIDSEKETPPNVSLRGFDVIDIVKSELEDACPGIVSCADILVLAARESVILSGGPFYPLRTGRRDSNVSFPEEATHELPSPQDNLQKAIATFASRGFDERETVSLLGAHSTGTTHCQFFENRLYNFEGTDGPDPSMDIEFLHLLRSKCNSTNMTSSSSSPPPSSSSVTFTSAPSPSPSESTNISLSSVVHDPGLKMDYEGPGSAGFGTLYYRSLLQGRGILFVDQQLTAGKETETWVRAYASDVSLFRQEFSLAMMKLSSSQVLTAPSGQIRRYCRKVVQ